MFCQLDQILTQTASQFSDKVALDDNKKSLTYQQLDAQVSVVANYFASLRLKKGSRLGIYLPKQVEAVIAKLAASRAGLVFVPINPLLKPPQVSYILQDCNVQLLITSGPRANQLDEIYGDCPDLKLLLLVDERLKSEPLIEHQFWAKALSKLTNPDPLEITNQSAVDQEAIDQKTIYQEAIDQKTIYQEAIYQEAIVQETIDQDLAAILYTSGSTGKPKGVCLSHRNLIAGAQSVSHYLQNSHSDILLAVLPLSFDYGLSQVTTGLLKGAKVVLMEYLLPRDVIRQVEKHQVTGLAAVPPLWFQLAQLEWPPAAKQSLRYITNSGGAMPKATLQALREQLPNTQPFLMYGLTEAFRSTYLDPNEIDRRPDSIGKAIPNAQIMICRQDGSECEADEIGELVHRGVHVSLGYWNAPEKTAMRFKPIGQNSNYLIELAVWSGDQAKKDSDGFIYFIGRADDMIKSSGYRISPSELEDSLFLLEGVKEVAALGVDDEQLGQAVALILSVDPNVTQEQIKKYCLQQLPNFMQPKHLIFVEKLPRNPNGKIDRTLLKKQYQNLASREQVAR